MEILPALLRAFLEILGESLSAILRGILLATLLELVRVNLLAILSCDVS